MVAVAQISNVNFPLRMPGELITGTVTLKNVGNETTSVEAGFFGVMVKTLWDGGEYTLFTYAIIAPGETFTFDFHEFYPAGMMPEGEAVLEIVGRTWLGDVWRVDDVKSWILSEDVPTPEPKPLLSLLLIAALALLFYGRR